MASSQLMLHCGAIEVARDRLAAIEAPPPEGRWFPVKHGTFVDTVGTTLEAAGYRIVRERHALARDNHRYFGTLDLDSPLASGVSLAVGIRNSTDKSFPLGFCAGSRVFICDNLAFRSELLVKRKHTRFGEQRFNHEIAGAIANLRAFSEVEAQRIRRLQQTAVSEAQASLCVLKALEKGIIASTVVARVWKEVLNPSFEYGLPDGTLTLWGVLNAFTTVLGHRAKKAPAEYAGQTMRLNALLLPHEIPLEQAA